VAVLVKAISVVSVFFATPLKLFRTSVVQTVSAEPLLQMGLLN